MVRVLATEVFFNFRFAIANFLNRTARPVEGSKVLAVSFSFYGFFLGEKKFGNAHFESVFNHALQTYSLHTFRMDVQTEQ